MGGGGAGRVEGAAGREALQRRGFVVSNARAAAPSPGGLPAPWRDSGCGRLRWSR